jgi:hypothetical protein
VVTFLNKKPLFSSENLGGFSEISGSGNNQINRGFFSFLIIGCLLSSFLQYSWRSFIQYPIELINGSSLTNTKINGKKELGSGEITGFRVGNPLLTKEDTLKNSQNKENSFNLRERDLSIVEGNLIGEANLAPSSKTNFPIPLREFPSFDSNIRHREKNLPVDRHIPIEKMNTRRTLSGRPALNEEQKSDAFFRFNSFFINNLEAKVENKVVDFRNSSLLASSIQQNNDSEISYIAEYLEKVKRVLSKENFEETKGATFVNLVPSYVSSPHLQYSLSPKIESPISRNPRALENNTKGKPPKGFSFISENIDGVVPVTTSQAWRDEVTSPPRRLSNIPGRDSENFPRKTKNPYLHDELQIYGVLFGGGPRDIDFANQAIK